MSHIHNNGSEETLDPEDWQAFAEVGQQMLDDMLVYLLLRLQESGVALPTSTIVNGRYAIRCAITNHRTRREDFNIFLSELIQIANGMLASGWP